jgi:hypothetical protein
MCKKAFYFMIGVSILASMVYAQPNVVPNEVTLYLSNGEVQTGILIEMKINVTPKDRVLVIWHQLKGYITYPFQDVEALTQNYTRDKVERDLGNIKWRSAKDYIVLIRPLTGQKIDQFQGIFSNYNNVKGIYRFTNVNAEYKWKEVGAIYFFNSDHSHFTSIPNEHALPPTLLKNLLPNRDQQNNNTSGPRLLKKLLPNRNQEINNTSGLKPARRPDLIVNLPAATPLFKGAEVNAGERYYIEVSGQIRINPSVEVGPAGFGGDIPARYKPEVATGVVLAFIAPSGDYHIKVPASGDLFALGAESMYVTPKYGSLCFTINDTYQKDNAGSFEIKIWRFD